MSSIVWWFGAVHLALYSIGGTAAVSWWIADITLRRLGYGRVVVRWYFDHVRRGAK